MSQQYFELKHLFIYGETVHYDAILFLSNFSPNFFITHCHIYIMSPLSKILISALGKTSNGSDYF